MGASLLYLRWNCIYYALAFLQIYLRWAHNPQSLRKPNCIFVAPILNKHEPQNYRFVWASLPCAGPAFDFSCVCLNAGVCNTIFLKMSCHRDATSSYHMLGDTNYLTILKDTFQTGLCLTTFTISLVGVLKRPYFLYLMCQSLFYLCNPS